MDDTVKYQLDRAEDALRSALQFASNKEDPYLLRNIVEVINTIHGWKTNFKYNLTKQNNGDMIEFQLSTSTQDRITSELINLD
jgi:hypothetical protein